MDSIESDQKAPQPNSAIVENFHLFPASKAPPEIHSRLESRLKIFRKPKPDIATALSTGWLATASRTNIRLFRLEKIHQTKTIKKVASFECRPEYGEVREIAISEDILAVITYSHLLVYEHKSLVKNNIDSTIDIRQIDQNQAWIPRSVAIRQQGLVVNGLVSNIWVAVGGEGNIGVKLFKYSYNNRWGAKSDRFNLTCARNTSSMKIVGFSPESPDIGDQIIVVGATGLNRVYCWGINDASKHRVVKPSWTLDCNQGMDGIPHRSEIASAAVFISPSKRPYLFCAINNHRESRIIRGFTVYLDPAQRNQEISVDRWRELPMEAIQRNSLCATVTPNGQFIVVLDPKSMRLLSLQGGCKGGLTCLTRPLEWPSSLESAALGVSGISISVKEKAGALEIIAVDGRGHIDFRGVSVPGMPPSPSILLSYADEKTAITKVQGPIGDCNVHVSRDVGTSSSRKSPSRSLSASTEASSSLPNPLPQTLAPVCLPGSKCPNFIDSSLSVTDQSISDGEQSHSIAKQESGSTAATTVRGSVDAESFEDSPLNTSTQTDSDDFLLNPIGYLDKIKHLKQLVFQNSAHGARNEVPVDSPPVVPDTDILLHELQNIISKSHQSLKTLQESGFCGSFFSILVLDWFRPAVATLLPIEVAEVESLSELFRDTVQGLKEIELEDTYTTPMRDHYALLTSACRELLFKSQIIPSSSKPLSSSYLWVTAVQFIDLAVLSYVGAHVENLECIYRDGSNKPVHIPSRVGALGKTNLAHLTAGNVITVQKRQLQCLDKFLRHRSVWVFQHATMDPAPERLYLSTDVNTLADIWGPLWKIKEDIDSPKVSRYDIGHGFIVPWDRKTESDPNICANSAGAVEAFCHWVSNRDWNHKDFEETRTELENKSFLEIDRLLIGARVKGRLEVNDQCDLLITHKLNIKQDFFNQGNLRPRGTRRSRQKKSSQSYQIQVSAMGFGSCGTTKEYKRIEGFNRKDALLQRWRTGAREIKCLEIWGGVEVSLCTGNARRIQLLHLLRSRSMKMYLKLLHFQWVDPECETAYFEALENRQSFQRFWTEHPEWQRNIGDAINECFIALEDTGVDDETNELSALWVDVFEEYGTEQDLGYHFAPDPEDNNIVLRRAKHSWTGLLKDSQECLTMAVAGDMCLSFSNGSGMRCQRSFSGKDGKVMKGQSPGSRVLQTAIVINEVLIKGHDRRRLRRHTLSLKKKIADLMVKHNHAEKSSHQGRGELASSDPAACLVECYEDTSQSPKEHGILNSLRVGTEFYLGSQGYLKVIMGLTDGFPVLMEWSPVVNTVGKGMKAEFNERILGKGGDLHHSEYMGGIFPRSPLPCLILSSSKRDTKE